MEMTPIIRYEQDDVDVIIPKPARAIFAVPTLAMLRVLLDFFSVRLKVQP